MKEVINKSIERKVLLNPGPATTSARVKSALITEDICPREKEFGDLLFDVRQKVTKVVNAGPNYEGILLGGSGTGAIESCLSSCTNTDDGILIIENGAYGKRMKQICDNLGIFSQVIRFEWGQAIDWKEVDQFLSKNNNKFNVLAFVHHETTTGILNSISEFKSVADKYKMVSLVDAMSSFAGIKIDLVEDDVDYLISSSNKCIQGMAGLGIVIVKASELERIKGFKKKSFYFDLYANFLSQKEKNQFLFTPPVQILFALNAALDEFFEDGGVKARASKYSSLYEEMYEGMCNLGFVPLLEEKDNSRILTTFLEPEDKNYNFESMHNYLYFRGITIYPGKVAEKKSFRISNIGQLGSEDIQLFLQHIGEYIDQAGIRLK
jgi:2-aminoethylphosphonate aminotransferase